MFSIQTLVADLGRPSPYQGGAELWRDSHIAGQMMGAHLAPDTDAASYKPDTIRAICDSLPARMGLSAGARIVDLGCGPGLYCSRLAQLSFHMSGIDWSENSIRYAETLCVGQSAEFQCISYLEPFAEGKFDGALLISQDYGVLNPFLRQTLLQNVHSALRQGGTFALDVPGMAAFDALRERAAPTWEAESKGFWRPHPFVLLSATHFYPDIPASCDLYAVMDGETTVYRIWQTYFTPDSIRSELRKGGFETIEVTSGLIGDRLTDDAAALGVICRKT